MTLNGRAASGVWSVSEPTFFPFDFAKNSNFSLNAPAQFQRILCRSETIVTLQIDEILRFWTEVACENIQSLWEGSQGNNSLGVETEETKRCQKRIRISNVLRVTSPTHLPLSSTIESCKVRLLRISIARKPLDEECSYG
jgi:hypothetical protein